MATTTYSIERTKEVNFRTSDSYNALRPDEKEGRLRIAYFSGRTAAQDGASSDVIELCTVPAGARIIDIVWCSDDLSSAGATIAIGDADDPDRLVSAFDIATAAIAHRAVGTMLSLRTPDNVTETAGVSNQTVGFGYRYPAETVIKGTLATGALLTGADYAGAIYYVVD